MNLPNKITLVRIFMIPIFVAVFFLDGILPYNYIISGVIFALAACTDFIDGYIARKYNLVTNLGKFLDPIADKVLVSTAMMLILTLQGGLFFAFGKLGNVLYIATAICVCIIMARELIISAFSALRRPIFIPRHGTSSTNSVSYSWEMPGPTTCIYRQNPATITIHLRPSTKRRRMPPYLMPGAVFTM